MHVYPFVQLHRTYRTAERRLNVSRTLVLGQDIDDFFSAGSRRLLHLSLFVEGPKSATDVTALLVLVI